MGKKAKKVKKIKVNRERKHTRVIDTITGPLERPVLRWLAARQPAWATPDMLTGFSFLGTLITSVSYVLSRQNSAWLWPASLGFIIHWYGDSLDGTLARYRHIERPRYGYFLDHSLDALSTALIFFSLGTTPYVRFEIAALALVGYLLLSVYAALAIYVADEFRISYMYLGPTEMRIIAVICNTLMYFNGERSVHLFGAGFTWFEMVLFVLIVLFYGAYFVSCKDRASQLAIKEPAQGIPTALTAVSDPPANTPARKEQA